MGPMASFSVSMLRIALPLMVRPGGTFLSQATSQTSVPSRDRVTRVETGEAAARAQDDLVLGPRLVARLARVIAERGEQALHARVVEACRSTLGLSVGGGPSRAPATSAAVSARPHHPHPEGDDHR